MHKTMNLDRVRTIELLSLASVVFAMCTILFNKRARHITSIEGGRRTLSALESYIESSKLVPWAENNFIDITITPDPENETPLFWHIPKSGGTTAKRLYECLGLTLANRLGADKRFGHDQDEEVEVFHPFPTTPDVKFVNVDTTTKAGILRAEKMGLVPSGKADIIFTSDLSFAGEHLFSPEHRGRIFALFRNPVDRAVSKFYYLQTATWERTYRPEWVGMSVVEWATKHNLDENFLVKKILGKKLSDTADVGDLVIAKEIIRRRFVVGLMTDMEESIRRFNIVLGLQMTDVCHEEYFGAKEEKKEKAEEVSAEDPADGEERAKANDSKNSTPHPKVSKHYAR